MATPSIPSTARALHVPSKAQPLALTTVPVPVPKANEVLIKVLSTGLNPHDSVVQNTGILTPSFPFIPGADLAGTVVRVGEGVSKYAVGDEVFGQTNWITPPDEEGKSRLADFSGAREYALLDVRSSAKVGECGFGAGLEALDNVTTLPTNAVAAMWGFIQENGFGLPLSSVFGETREERKKDGFDAGKHDLVVMGGGSQLGKLVVQFARIMGWRRIVAVAGLKNEKELMGMGATSVVDRQGGNEKVIREIREIVGDELRYSYNCVSFDRTVSVAVLSNSIEGHMISVTFGEVTEKELVGKKTAGYKDTFVQGMSMNSVEGAKSFWERLPIWLKNGEVKVPKWTAIEGLDAAKAQEVLDRYRDQKAVPEHVHIHP